MKPVPIGEGLVARRLRLRREDVYVLGGILAGEDHLASLHGEPSHGQPSHGQPSHGQPSDAGDGRVAITVMTTEAQAETLDAWLSALADELDLEALDPTDPGGA